MKDLFGGIFQNKPVFLTGHTGFVGSWMIIWLDAMGAKITGFSLEPPSRKNLFQKAGLSERLTHIHGDVRDLETLFSAMSYCRPEIVFHLAAQSLVRTGYDDPVGTYATNIMGTVNLLQAVRRCPSVRTCQIMTSDKCYENRETEEAFTEDQPLGGRDPYSSSKAGAEIVAAAFRQSYFKSSVSIATVRAGNILGGGDWGKDRLVPDCIRALEEGSPVRLRNPDAVRPWQYILEPLSGIFHLASLMCGDPVKYGEPWNMGPVGSKWITVGEVADKVIRLWGSGTREAGPFEETKKEAGILRLDVSKAVRELCWGSLYDIEKTLEKTVVLYRNLHLNRDADPFGMCLEQIGEYVDNARSSGAPWTG